MRASAAALPAPREAVRIAVIPPTGTSVRLAPLGDSVPGAAGAIAPAAPTALAPATPLLKETP